MIILAFIFNAVTTLCVVPDKKAYHETLFKYIKVPVYVRELLLSLLLLLLLLSLLLLLYKFHLERKGMSAFLHEQITSFFVR